MRRLLFALLLLTGAALAQTGNTVTITAAGAPTGSCSYIFRYIDSATGNEYNCKAGVWNQVGGGAVTTEAHTANNTATTLAFTTCITGSHTVYRFDLSEIIPATANADLQVVVSTDGGSTYSATTYNQQFVSGVSGSGRSDNVTSGTKFLLDDPNDQGLVNTANIGLTGWFTLNNPAGGSFKEFTGQTYYERGFDGTTVSLTTGGSWKTTTAVNAVRFQTSAGNIVSGTITCTPIV